VFGLMAFLYSQSPQMQERTAMAIQEVKTKNPVEITSVSQRLFNIEISLQLISEKPILGWGTGAYHDQYCRLSPTPQVCDQGRVHPHNQFLFIAVDHGMVGLGWMLLFTFAPMWMARNSPAHHKGLAAAFTGIFIVTSLTHGSLWLSTESHFSTLMAALLFVKHAGKSRS
jgi:O-antigen ligase